MTKPEFNLTSEAQTVEVEVKYNVDFSVIIPEECKEWVRQIATKGLEKKIYTFSISKNDTYDNRECSITFKEKKGALSASVTIKQAQTDYLEVGQKEYTVDVGGEIIEIEVKSNVAYNVAIANNALSWLSIVDTKSLSTDKVLVSVAAGDDNTDRKGDIVISYGDMKHTVSVHQYSFAANTIIQFADARIKEKLVAAFDTNKDGELSIKEAQQVKSIDGVFGKIKTYKSFDEFQYFTGVKEISAETFSGWTLLTSIKIPEGIESLPSLAFDNCVSLTTVGIPKSLKYFYGNYCVFVGCTSLKNLEIADLTSWCETDFKGWLFSGDTKIEHLFLNGKEIVDLVIPDNTTRISGAAFENLLNLRTVVIPDSVKGIENAAFANCTGLKSITIGKGVKKICYDTFLNCTSLTKVEISDLSAWCEINYDATTFINHDSVPGGSPLYYARHLYLNGKEVKGALTIPSGCTKTGVFYGCDITSVTIPNTVTSISPYAFQGCRALTSVEIPNSVTSIENYAFQGCTGLASVEIPNSVTGIWKYAFQGCTGLTSVEIPSSVTSIGTYAFQGCKNLKKVVIPSSTKNVEKYSFYDIAPSVTLISGVTSDRNGNPTNIIDNRFNGSINLIIPDSVTEIGYYRWCDVLVSVVIPESVSSIGSRAFSNCKNLTSVTIPESVMSIGFEAFASCNSLTSVIIPESVRVIEESAFHATSLQAIEIPKNVKKIGKMAFRNCPLKKIIVHPTTPPEAEDREFFDGSTCKIQVPSASVESYRTTRWWDTYADRIVAIGN